MAERKPASPERKAANAEAARAYRARQVAIRAGVDIPAAIAAKREARYRPARVSEHVQKVRVEQTRRTTVQRAVDKGAAERAARAEFVKQFPQAKNPKENIEPPNFKARLPGREATVQKIRQGHRASRLQPHGAKLRQDFADGGFNGLQDTMNRSERRKFRALSARASKVTSQALAIYFQFEGGSGEFGSIITQIRYGAAGHHKEVLTRMSNLVKRLELAETLYGRKAAGPTNV